MMTGQPTPAPLDTSWMAQLTADMIAQSQNESGIPLQSNTDQQATVPGSHGSASMPAQSHSHHPSGQQTLMEDMGDAWTPLFGSPRGTEAFSDQWGGTLNQMGGQLAGPMRDDFFSCVLPNLRICPLPLLTDPLVCYRRSV